MSTFSAKSKNKLKATSDSDNSGSIVASFAGRWKELLEQNKVGVYFRKQGPLTAPDYVYVYAAAPTSGIIGRAKVLSHQKVTLSDALQMASRGAISEDELRQYGAGSHSGIWATSLDKYEPFKREVPRIVLRDEFNCIPPQGFFFLSKSGMKELDSLGKRAKSG